MHNRRTLTRCFALLAGLFACTFLLAAEWEKKLVIHPENGELSRAQAPFKQDFFKREEDRKEDRIEKGTAQKIWKEGGRLLAQYNFINFNRDALGVSFDMTVPEYDRYIADYGYTDSEMAALRAWRGKAHAAAWDTAIRKGGKPAAEKAIAEVATEYDTKVRALLFQRGLALRTGNVIECDMRQIVKRNVEKVKSLALSFQKLSSEKGYGPEETVGAVLSMVQTAIRYQIPPMMEGALHTGGLLPPVKALLNGWGDCDTKTGVAAAILSNWSGMRLVGIAVPGHYLMAIRRIPGKGDMFVRYEGLEYVLIEPAGPAWLEPGSVGSSTAALLEGSAGYTVEPFF